MVMTQKWMAGAALVATLGVGPAAAAEPEDRPISTAVERLSFDSVETAATEPGPLFGTAADSSPQPPPPVQRSRKARVGRAIAGAAVGAVGGAFAGGYLGAAIDGDCGGCDDPGLKGFLIGFPTGGVVGGVLGGLFLFR
jgi:hypothetical protein